MEEIITAEQLASALNDVLNAWEYNGGGDKWTRQVYGDDIERAGEVLRLYKLSQTGEPRTPDIKQPRGSAGR